MKIPWYKNPKTAILPSRPPILSVASARIQFALGPVRWPFRHLDLSIWGREWGVMKEGVFFFVALKIDIGIWHFFILFRMVHQIDDFGSTIFEPLKKITFLCLGFCANFFTPQKNWGFSPNWTKVPSNSSIFWPQGVKGQATTKPTLPRAPEALDDAAPSPAKHLRNHKFFVDSTLAMITISLAVSISFTIPSP